MYMLYRVDFQFLTVATLSSVNPIMQSNQYKTLVKEEIYAKLQYHVSWAITRFNFFDVDYSEKRKNVGLFMNASGRLVSGTS